MCDPYKKSGEPVTEVLSKLRCLVKKNKKAAKKQRCQVIEFIPFFFALFVAIYNIYLFPVRCVPYPLLPPLSDE